MLYSWITYSARCIHLYTILYNSLLRNNTIVLYYIYYSTIVSIAVYDYYNRETNLYFLD